MSFPTIPTAAAGRVLTTNQLDSSGTRTFPTLTDLTKNSGDLLIAIIVAYQSSTTDAQFSSWGGGFTEFHDSGTGTTLAIGCAYKWSTGSETGTFTVTQAATITGDASMILLSIPGAHATTPPEAGSRANGTSAAADPASFNPAGWDVEDTLWISLVGSGMTSGTGSWTATGTAAPTDYTDRVDTNASDTSTIGDCEAAVAFRQVAAASEDVGTAGVDTSNARNSALVIAVRPVPAEVTGTGLGAFDFSPTVAGTVDHIGTVAEAFAFTATGSGEAGVVGVIAEAFTFTGAASGQAGAPPVEGQALGAYTFGSTAAGVVDVAGQALAALTFGSTAQGVPGHDGAAVGAWTFGSTAVGTVDVAGQAAGAFTFTGAASGQILGAVQGQALGDYVFGSTTQGVPGVVGRGLGAFMLDTVTAGVPGHDGAALGAFTFTGDASGAVPGAVFGAALGDFSFAALAAGAVVGPLTMRPHSGVTSQLDDNLTLRPVTTTTPRP